MNCQSCGRFAVDSLHVTLSLLVAVDAKVFVTAAASGKRGEFFAVLCHFLAMFASCSVVNCRILSFSITSVLTFNFLGLIISVSALLHCNLPPPAI